MGAKNTSDQRLPELVVFAGPNGSGKSAIYDNTADAPYRIIRKHKESIQFFENQFWSFDRIAKLALGGKT